MIGTVIIGGLVAFVVWWMRPPFDRLLMRHWAVAVLMLPVEVLAVRHAPDPRNLYNRSLVIECKRLDGGPLTGLVLDGDRSIPENTTIMPDATGRFHVTVNKEREFHAEIRADGCLPERVDLNPSPKDHVWFLFRDTMHEPERLPLDAPGTITVTLERAPGAAKASAPEPP